MKKIILITVCIVFYACNKKKNDDPAPVPTTSTDITITESVIKSPTFRALLAKNEDSAYIENGSLKLVLTNAIDSSIKVPNLSVSPLSGKLAGDFELLITFSDYKGEGYLWLPSTNSTNIGNTTFGSFSISTSETDYMFRTDLNATSGTYLLKRVGDFLQNVLK